MDLMTDKIPPALTPEEWQRIRKDGIEEAIWNLGRSSGFFEILGLNSEDRPAAISVLNDILPDSDPRKITREKVQAMRECIEQARAYEVDIADSMDSPPRQDAPYRLMELMAESLESYLPPE